MRHTAHFFTFVVTLLFSLTSQAQNSSSLFGDEDSNPNAPRISDFGWSDKRHIEKQVERIDDIARRQLGTPVRGDKSDIGLLQRIVYRGLIEQSDTMTLQAMGAVLGNIFTLHEELEWRVFEDQYGKSRAVCVINTQECLFPITMLSRRMEVGILVDVQKVYDDAMEMAKPLLRKTPYSTGN